MGLSELSADALAAWVRASCAAQGVAVRVTDPRVLRDVSVLLGLSPGREPAQARSGSRRPAGGDLQTPHGLDAGRVQGAGSGLTRGDHGVVEDGLHDGPLPGQVQRRPLSA